MSSLKNPLEKKRKTYTDFRYLPEGKWKKCGCICPLCKGDFQAKTMGRFDNHILRILESRVMKRLPL